MAEIEEVKKELNKLNKSDLIRIIIEKKVPLDIKSSDKVVKYVESDENTKFPDVTTEISDNSSTDHAHAVSHLTLKYDLKVANIQLEASTRIIKELERTISNQDYIINLLQNPANLQVNHVPNTNKQSGVAGHPPNSVAKAEGKKTKGIHETRENITITNQQFSSALTQAQQSLKMNDIHSLGQNQNKTRSDAKVVGNNSESEELATKDKVWIYAAKYKQSYSTQKLETYLQTKFPGHEFSCTLYENKVNGSNSFRITADAELKDILFQPQTWPKGIEVAPKRKAEWKIWKH
uniref:Uncharacterized protein LOC114337937 n=1 Tax=Diabrotica virgifera virgifera TaxID=50390 RepID=A0A6P7GGV0_DIAVI